MKPEIVTIKPEELTRHAAFLGGTGSGKSTLAMNIIEQLLLQDIPVLLVDRKGDLASYANPAAWELPAPDADSEARRKRLKERLDIALYTPGHPNGRPLAISIVPEGTFLLPAFERERIAAHSAAAMANMMGFKTSSTPDLTCRGILSKAISYDKRGQTLPNPFKTFRYLLNPIERRQDPRVC